jgi:CBS domain-containing protein
MLRVRDCMIQNPKTVTPGASLREAIEVMLAEGLDGLAVVDERNHCLGVITLGYLLRGFMPDHLRELSEAMLDEVEEVSAHAFFGPTSILFLVADFFKEDVEPLSADLSLMFAGIEMERQMLSLLPVVENDKLVGVLYLNSIMQGFFNMSSFSPSEKRSEE